MKTTLIQISELQITFGKLRTQIANKKILLYHFIVTAFEISENQIKQKLPIKETFKNLKKDAEELAKHAFRVFENKVVQTGRRKPKCLCRTTAAYR